MKNWKNWRISAKLLSGFLTVAVLAAVVGAIGIYGIYTINQADDKLYEENLLAIDSMGDIRENLQRQRVELRNIVIYSGNAAGTQTAINTMKQLEDQMELSFAEYDGTITDSSAEGDYYTARRVYENEYAAIKNDVTAASAQSQEAGEAKLADPTVATVTNAMVDGFSRSARNNEERAKARVDANTALFATLTIVQVAVLLIALGAAVGLGLFIAKMISRPMDNLRAIADQIGGTGNMNFPEEFKAVADRDAQCKDEIGQSLLSFINMIHHFENMSGVLKQVARGDLTQTVPLLSDKDTIGVSLNDMLDNLNNMFAEVNSASAQVSAGSGQVSQSAQNLASGSSEQAASIEELSAAITEVKSQVDDNAERSQKALDNCDAAGTLMGASMESMGQMLEAMQGIGESSKNITRVIKVIDDIAFQTNILALNAAVEAARAGQHGKGFAVVADEVRNLASKSAAAAKETATLIEGSTQRVDDGSRIVEQTNESLKAVGVTASENAVIIGEMAKSLDRQMSAVDEINQGVEQISTVVQANAATAEESAAASEEMAAQSAMLSEIVSRFRIRPSGVASGQAMAAVGSGKPHAQSSADGFSLTYEKY